MTYTESTTSVTTLCAQLLIMAQILLRLSQSTASWMKMIMKNHLRGQGQVKQLKERTAKKRKRGEMLWILRLVAEAGTMSDEDDGLEYQLPKHYRCDFHLMKLGVNSRCFRSKCLHHLQETLLHHFQSAGVYGAKPVDPLQLQR